MQKNTFLLLLLSVIFFLSDLSFAKTKVVLIAGKDSHGTNAHNWGEGVDLLSNALTKESGLNIETAIHKGGWPTDPSIFKNADTVVILSDGGGRHPINQNLKEFDLLADKGVGLVCVHYAVEVPKGAPGDMMKKWLGGYFEKIPSFPPMWLAVETSSSSLWRVQALLNVAGDPLLPFLPCGDLGQGAHLLRLHFELIGDVRCPARRSRA